MQEVSLTKKCPAACSDQDIEEFVHLVLEGGQVQEGGLRDLVMEAQWLGFGRIDGVLNSVAAIKAPRDSYRNRVFRKAKAAEDPTEFDVEFGWAFTRTRYEGHGLASGLADLLLRGINAPILATTGEKNGGMRHILEKRMFCKSGEPYEGRIESKVLYLRIPPVVEETEPVNDDC